jgi:carotenoid cleavage dioxygenase
MLYSLEAEVSTTVAAVPANPYLDDFLAPVSAEVTATDLPVTGHIPDFLDGRYLRNGPNPVAEVDPATYHWFTGDGMVHGVALQDGNASWYRNRWVRSAGVRAALGEPAAAARNLRAGMQSLGANTNVVAHAGKTLALVEGGVANYELTDELDTVGACDFDGTLTGGYAAHPHRDPHTGELHAVSYSFARGRTVQYSVIDTHGHARHTVDIAAPGPVGGRSRRRARAGARADRGDDQPQRAVGLPAALRVESEVPGPHRRHAPRHRR